MRAHNDTIVPGQIFAAAVRSILPLGRKRDPGYIILHPAAAGTITLERFYASAPVPPEGAWTDAVYAPGVFLRSFAMGKPPAAARLVFFDCMLSINGTTLRAYAVA